MKWNNALHRSLLISGSCAAALLIGTVAKSLVAQDIAMYWAIDTTPLLWGVDTFDGSGFGDVFLLDTVLFAGIYGAEIDADGNVYVLAGGVPPLADLNLLRNGLVVHSWSGAGWDMAVTPAGEVFVLREESGGSWFLSRLFEGVDLDVTALLPELGPGRAWPHIDIDSEGTVWCLFEDESGQTTEAVLARNGVPVFSVPAGCATDVYSTNLSIDSNDRVFVMAWSTDCQSADDVWVVYRWADGAASLIQSGLGLDQPDESVPDDFGVDLHGRIWILEDETNTYPVGCELLLDGSLMASSDDHQCQGMSIQKTRWRDLGHALAGASGDPFLTASGSMQAGDPVYLTLTGAATSAPAFLFVGFSELNATGFYGGTLIPNITATGLLVILVTDGAGKIELSASWPAAVTPGFETFLQYWIEDAGGPFGYAASNGMVGVSP